MKREEAIKFWKFRYENAKDYTDPHWEAQERREHREYVEALRMAIEALAERTGEWKDIDNYYRMATCSHCHKVTMFEKWGEYTKPYDYCPNCGADMRGEQDG